jgi:hypothetical protein
MHTQIYTRYTEFKDAEYISKVARTADEATQLIDAGFDYILTTPDELMIFRRQK